MPVRIDAHPFAGEIGRHVLALAQHRGLGEIFPERRVRIARRRIDLHVGDEALIISRQHAEIILEPEADRQPRGIGRETKHIEAHAFGKFRSECRRVAGPCRIRSRMSPTLPACGDFIDVRKHRAESAFGLLRHLGV